MSGIRSECGMAPSGDARIYYEVAGEGRAFVMIHAGVADSRQWNNEFAHFADQFRVVRYDMRGYGKSAPVEGEFRHIDDLAAVLDHLGVDRPAVVMGCSIGGGLAMDFALAQPDRVGALIMVGSAPSGLVLDVVESPLIEEAEKAWEARDLDRLVELEARMFFDGMGRASEQVDQSMRQLMLEMDRHALGQQARGLGKRLADAEVPAAVRLDALHVPLLIIAGEHDEPYTHAAADYMIEHVPGARKVMIQDAAHLPNMDQPRVFRHIVTTFLNDVEWGQTQSD